MTSQTSYPLPAVLDRFEIAGDFVSACPYGSGHINDTFAATFNQGGTPVRYILQRINHQIFKNPPALMDNIVRVTDHIRARLLETGAPDVSRRVLTLIPTRDGKRFLADDAGLFWRVYVFIERARTYDVIENTGQALEAARAFGRFQRALADLSGPRLHETIPGFHHTPTRFAALRAAVEQDTMNRAASVKAEIAFAFARESMANELVGRQAAGALRECVTHNDTKLNNVMLDDVSREGICVIDLDTVMPGLPLYDFGDMVRTATITAAEDERDLSRVGMAMPMFEALARGYLEAVGDWMSADEAALLPLAGKLLTYECGIRFLTDYLQGDRYFRIHRPDHNLDRCRTQFKLIACIEAQEDEMRRRVDLIRRG